MGMMLMANLVSAADFSDLAVKAADLNAFPAPFQMPETPPSTRSCELALDRRDVYLSEGPATYWDGLTNIRSSGSVHAKVIFIDFPDAASSESPESILDAWMTPGVDWLNRTSYGRVSVILDPVIQWFRMPKPASAYGDPGFSQDTHREYIADALAVADPSVDFSQTDFIYIVAARTRSIPGSPTFRGPPGTFVLDGRQLGPAVTFGFDAYTWGRMTLPHETGHLFGLPDVYSHVPPWHQFVGVWDYMGDHYDPTDLSAWHRLKLGWLDPVQFTCADGGKTTVAALTPLGASDGMKAIFVRTSGTTGLLVENRQPVGNDAGICDSGALVYTVDSSVKTGEGPMHVVGGDISGRGCGYGLRSDAPLHIGESANVGNVKIEVIGGTPKSLSVRVTVP